MCNIPPPLEYRARHFECSEKSVYEVIIAHVILSTQMTQIKQITTDKEISVNQLHLYHLCAKTQNSDILVCATSGALKF
jgi:hypothetical protein